MSTGGPASTDGSERRTSRRTILISIGAVLVLVAAAIVVVVTTRPASPAGGGILPSVSAGADTSAAKLHGWGDPDRVDEFTGPLDSSWDVYDGPGHNGNGRRSPDAAKVEDGVLTITGDTDGATGGLAWVPGQMYGRWEARVRAPVGDPTYNALLLLWPDAEDWPVGGEVDWMEISDPTRQETGFFLHFGEDNGQEAASVTRDATRWTAWALEWTPEKMTAFVNGEEWYSTTETSHFPPRPMNMTMQLDWFGAADTPTAMQMDWARQWALPESEPATLSLAPGDPATGQPELFPDRTPRPVGG